MYAGGQTEPGSGTPPQIVQILHSLVISKWRTTYYRYRIQDPGSISLVRLGVYNKKAMA